MSKCMYQNCDCEATKTLPCIIGPKEIKEDVRVCNFHYNLLTQPKPILFSVKQNKEVVE